VKNSLFSFFHEPMMTGSSRIREISISRQHQANFLILKIKLLG
jgi:hypothetical protein